MKKSFLILFLPVIFLMTSSIAYSQAKQDVVYLKNGSVIRGEIIEQVPNVSIKIKTRDGSIFVYTMEEISKITKEKALGVEEEEEEVETTTSSKKYSGLIWSLGAGISLPVIEDSFTDFSLGPNFAASVGHLFSSSFGLELHSQYNSFEGGDFNISSLLVQMRLGNFSKTSKVNPYATVGLGLYVLAASYKSGGLTISVSESNFGLRVGGGANFKVGKRVGIFGELSLDYNLNDGTAKGYVPIKLGVMFTP